MKDESATHLPEEKESLWVLTAAPTIWAVHLLLSYITAAVWCAKLHHENSLPCIFRCQYPRRAVPQGH